MPAKFNNKKQNTMIYEVKEVGIGPNTIHWLTVPISAIDDVTRQCLASGYCDVPPNVSDSKNVLVLSLLSVPT